MAAEYGVLEDAQVFGIYSKEMNEEKKKGPEI